MQENLRLVIYTIVSVFVLWFIVMTIDVHLFLHSDIDPLVAGTIPMSRTDIGNQCGEEYTNSNQLVDFKLTMENQIVYLCPPGIWPIRKTIAATTVNDAFRKSLGPTQRDKVNTAYPPENAEQPSNPMMTPTNPPATTTNDKTNAAAPTQPIAPIYQAPKATPNVPAANY